jgi:type II secretory pathway pseudopilin PulG
MVSRQAAGYSIVELAVVLGLAATATATALPRMLTRVDDARVEGAARYLSARFYDTRVEAIARSTEVALRFTPTNAGYVMTAYVDGNANGVLARDIDRNVDPQLHSPEQLSGSFSGVDFGTLPGLPAIDAGDAPPGNDPIRSGAGSMVSFSALGTSSSGTLYVKGRGGSQYAVRIVGATARVRIFRFDPRSQRWQLV